MRKLTLMLALATAAGLAAPAVNPAQAQWDAVRRRTGGTVDDRGVYDRGGVYDRDGVYRRDGVYDSRTASRVPPGHMPPPGMCRVWIDGVPPGRQPRPTDCTTAQREAYRYGSRAHVIYGGDRQGRSGAYGVYDTRSRVYDTVINGRNCRVTERWDGTRTQRRTDCESDDAVWSRRRAERSNVLYGRSSSAVRDDDSDGRGGKKYKGPKGKGGNGNGHGKGHGRGH